MDRCQSNPEVYGIAEMYANRMDDRRKRYYMRGRLCIIYPANLLISD